MTRKQKTSMQVVFLNIMDRAGQQLLAQLGFEDDMGARIRSALISLSLNETTLLLRLTLDENGKELAGFS